MKESKFNFYEIVQISSDDLEYREVNGKKAVVRGKVQCDNGDWYYTVALESGYTVSLFEYQMISLGKFVDPKEYHDGDETMKISVDKDGLGYLEIDDD